MLKRIKDYLITLLGILLLGTGLLLIKTNADPQGIMLSLPYVCVGIGSGAFGMGIGNIVAAVSVKKHPEVKKQMDIQKNDERNISIINRAKAKAYDAMVFIFGSLMLSYALMLADLTVVLLLVAAYLFIIVLRIYYQVKYDKEM
ncbi:MAG: hypothetical protein AB9835_09970 [Eubacteriales bacterium]